MYFFIVLLRLVCAPLIFVWPLPAIILSVILDIIDGDFACKVVSKTKYQLIDKNLDLWWFINIIIFVFIRYPQYKLLLSILFVYRLIGQLMFNYSNNRKYLVLFPNFFEWIFFLIFLGKNYFPNIIVGQNFYVYIIFICTIKIFQEWFLHVGDYSIKEIIFKKKRIWGK
jgi:hypothetical protein